VLEPMTSSELSLGAEVAAPPIVSHEQIVVIPALTYIAAHILALRALRSEMRGYELLFVLALVVPL